ncbi:hypothetical protein [Sporolactobacillus spathodeae]|uniref:Uncharacterized protein n=1 Tax=Sporolactobacillus spathodeae TaxID=1465502 RepID=A0ABS2Q528_9BACL|nr:hypothetical protein [Sporolactobacillus spathodeae]MBM7656887.1 hypothetical protein [Sporolactobacillus spathodeae]
MNEIEAYEETGVQTTSLLFKGQSGQGNGDTPAASEQPEHICYKRDLAKASFS